MKKHIDICSKFPNQLKAKYCNSAQDTEMTEQADSRQKSASSFGKHVLLDQTSAKHCKPKIAQFQMDFLDRITATEQNELEEMLARAIYASGTPLSIVEHP